MAGRVVAFLKNALDKEPAFTVTCGIMLFAIPLPFLSPYSKYSNMMKAAVPSNYPVPVRDDGNMPDIPSHPSDPQGPNLEWMKKL